MVVHTHHVTVEAMAARFSADATAAWHTLGPVGDACLHGLADCNLHFCIYGALAGVMFMQAWHAWQDRKPHHVRAHGMAGLVNVLMAILQWHG